MTSVCACVNLKAFCSRLASAASSSSRLPRTPASGPPAAPSNAQLRGARLRAAPAVSASAMKAATENVSPLLRARRVRTSASDRSTSLRERGKAALQDGPGRAADRHVAEAPARRPRAWPCRARCAARGPETRARSFGCGVVPAGHGRVALEAELGDRVGDGVVQAAIEGAELVDRERRIALERQVGDGLAEVAVVVDDLVDGKAQLQQFLAVRGGAHAHFRQGEGIAARGPGDAHAFGRFVGLFRFQRSRQLVEEQRNAVRKLCSRGGSFRPLGDLVLAARDQLVAIVSQESVHGGSRGGSLVPFHRPGACNPQGGHEISAATESTVRSCTDRANASGRHQSKPLERTTGVSGTRIVGALFQPLLALDPVGEAIIGSLFRGQVGRRSPDDSSRDIAVSPSPVFDVSDCRH